MGAASGLLTGMAAGGAFVGSIWIVSRLLSRQGSPVPDVAPGQFSHQQPLPDSGANLLVEQGEGRVAHPCVKGLIVVLHQVGGKDANVAELRQADQHLNSHRVDRLLCSLCHVQGLPDLSAGVYGQRFPGA
jgi:hypothetical protein